MLKIDIICVGKIKEKFTIQAVEEYIKRLSRYCRVRIIEVADEPTPDGAPDAVCVSIKEKEGERILKAFSDDSYVIALAIEGKRMDSDAFASYLDRLQVNGVSRVCFVIGGSLGLSEKVLSAADLKLSFSDFTFPHQLMRVILTEQIYRAMRISHGEPYHK